MECLLYTLLSAAHHRALRPAKLAHRFIFAKALAERIISKPFPLSWNRR